MYLFTILDASSFFFFFFYCLGGLAMVFTATINTLMLLTSVSVKMWFSSITCSTCSIFCLLYFISTKCYFSLCLCQSVPAPDSHMSPPETPHIAASLQRDCNVQAPFGQNSFTEQFSKALLFTAICYHDNTLVRAKERP